MLEMVKKVQENKKKTVKESVVVKAHLAPKKLKQSQKENLKHNGQQETLAKTQENPKSKPKRPQNGTIEANDKLPAKKRKLSEDQNEDKEQAEDIKPATEKRIDSSNINKGIFAIFNKLQDASKQNTQKHINEMIALLKNEANAEKRTATCAYALKRLVRCTGADDLKAVGVNASYINNILRDVPDLDPIDLLNLVKRELPSNANQKGKEESLAAVGQLITVLAIIETQYFKDSSPALIAAVYPILIGHLKGREYLVSLSADIMATSFTLVKKATFQKIVWPLLQPELNKPISSQKLHGCDLLLAVHLNYPTVLSMQQLETILWGKQTQYEQLFDVYLNSATMQGDALYTRLGKFLATAPGEQLAAWQKHIAEKLPLKHIPSKAYVIQTLVGLLLHYDDDKKTDKQLEQLFTLEPLLQMLLGELQASKKLTIKTLAKVKPAQREMRYICRKFETALLVSFKHQFKHDACKLSILRSLLEQHLQLDNIMQTPRFTHQVIRELGEEGIDEMYVFYSDQFTSNSESLTRSDREHCLKQMQQLQHSKRKEQLVFLLYAAVFHLNDQKKPCTADEAAKFSREAASRCEESLFTCLTNQIGVSTEQLLGFNEQLRLLLQTLAKKLSKPAIETKLRIRLTPEIQNAWEKVHKTLEAPATGKQPLAVIFDAIILFVGLAIFMTGCNVDLDLIDDLFICKQNALKAKKGKDKPRKSTADGEPNWQSVLTDVLLQLLSQTGSFWRQFVNAIGEALMPHLGKENLEQFLELLDMNENPFADRMLGDLDDNGDVDESVEEEQEDVENESNEEETTEEDDQASDDNEDDDDEEDSDDEEDDDDDDEKDDENEDVEDEATNLEQIRESVRQALLEDEASDDGASSVDWNDVDEEQGERLNRALERAFQIRKGANKGKNSKAPTKSIRVRDTALLHLRIRVLDLVELFITAQPELDIILDTLLCIQNVFNHSIREPKMQPLAEASKKTLRKLLNQKISYQSPKQSKEPIVDCIKRLMGQDEVTNSNANTPAGAQQRSSKVKGLPAMWRNKCIAYLISQFNEFDVTASAVWPLLQGFVQDWASRRNTSYQLGTFDEIFALPWSGNGQLMTIFYELLSTDLRSFRRIQILELLLKNCRRVAHTLSNKQATIKKFHNILTKYEPTANKDRNLQKKLLAQLKKLSAEG